MTVASRLPKHNQQEPREKVGERCDYVTNGRIRHKIQAT